MARREGFDIHEYQRQEIEREMRAPRGEDGGRAQRAPPRGAQNGGPGPQRMLAAAAVARRPPQPPSPFGPWREPEVDQREEAALRRGVAAPMASDRGRALDVHELLKQQIFESPSAACDNHFEKSRPCPWDVYGGSDQYFVLDSWNKLPESDLSRGVMRWNFKVQSTTDGQNVGISDLTDTVVSAQMGSFAFPILPDVPYALAAPPATVPSGRNQLILVQNNTSGAGGAPTLIPDTGIYGQYPGPALVPSATVAAPWVNNPYTQTPCGSRLTVQLVEAGAQAYSDANGARHHFEFILSYDLPSGQNPTMLVARPMAQLFWDTFFFTEPLQDIHGLTLIFRNPDSPLVFQPDVFYEAIVSSDSSASPGPFLQFTVQGHGLLEGDRIFVEGFSSGVSALDAYVNRPEGLVAASNPSVAPIPPSTPIPTPNTFWTDPAIGIADFVPPPTLPQTVQVFIAKRRIRIPMKMRRVVPRLTNYMTLSY